MPSSFVVRRGRRRARRDERERRVDESAVRRLDKQRDEVVVHVLERGALRDEHHGKALVCDDDRLPEQVVRDAVRVEVHVVRVGAALDERERDVAVVARDGIQQRRLVLVVARAHVGLCLEQQPDDLFGGGGGRGYGSELEGRKPRHRHRVSPSVESRVVGQGG